MDRRTLLKAMGASACVGMMPPRLSAAGSRVVADLTLKIGTGLVELAPDHIVSTILYNGQFPGPLLRMKEGQRVTIDIHNDTDRNSCIGTG